MSPAGPHPHRRHVPRQEEGQEQAVLLLGQDEWSMVVNEASSELNVQS